MASINDRSSRWSIAARLHPSSCEPWSVDREKIIWSIVPLVSIQISMVDGNRNSSFDQFQNSTAVFTLCNRIPIPYQIPRCHAIRPRVPAATSWKFTAGRSVYPDYVLINSTRQHTMRQRYVRPEHTSKYGRTIYNLVLCNSTAAHRAVFLGANKQCTVTLLVPPLASIPSHMLAPSHTVLRHFHIRENMSNTVVVVVGAG
jgi:hypothetical protein